MSEPEQTDAVELVVEEDGVLDIEERAEAFQDTIPISYFGTDFDVHGLVRRLNDGEILIPSFEPEIDTGTDIEGFQRHFVWKKFQMDRFIESLLLGYPVPGIFLVQQADRKMLVLDGQQRLRTLQQFYEGKLEKGAAFRLESVNEALRGYSYADLPSEDRRALDNTSLHAIIVKYESEGGASSVYQLFERLNTGGTNLYPQEIRVALYHGPLVRLVHALNQNPDWRALYGRPSDHLKDEELILRFLAFYTALDTYRRPLKGFLNRFLEDHRDLQSLDAGATGAIFAQTCGAISLAVGKRAFRLGSAQVNAALVDSVMVGVARRLERGPITDAKALEHAYDGLIGDPAFTTAIGRATADEERVRTRLGLAAQAFEAIA